MTRIVRLGLLTVSLIVCLSAWSPIVSAASRGTASNTASESSVRANKCEAPAADKCESYSAQAKTNDVLFLGGGIMTMQPDQATLLENGLVLICAGEIVQISSDASSSNDANIPNGCDPTIIELKPQDVVLPAFINAHTHAAMSLFKNLGNDRELNDWLQNFIFPLEGALVDEAFCIAGVRLAMAEFLATGTSLFADMYFFVDAVAKVVSDVGMRSYLGLSIIDFPQPDSDSPQNTLAIAEEYISKWKDHPLINPMLTPHAPYTTSADVYTAAVALNRKYGVRSYTHCSESKFENDNMKAHQGLATDDNRTATQFLYDLGVLGEDMTCTHSVWLTDEDIEIYKKTGTKVAHCPTSNMKLASGFMRYTALRDAGVPIGFGTDGQSSNNDLDLIEEARMGSLIHKGVDLDAKTMPALDTLRHMTTEGARVLGAEKRIGMLKEGMRGDVVVIRGDPKKWTPRFDVGVKGTRSVADTAALVVYDSSGADVLGTVVDGKVLYWDGCYTTMDIDQVLKDADEWGEKIRAFMAK